MDEFCIFVKSCSLDFKMKKNSEFRIIMGEYRQIRIAYVIIN